MTEENQKNTVGTVGMRFSIIGVIALISILIFIPIIFIVALANRGNTMLLTNFNSLLPGPSLLLIGLILGIIGLILGIIGLFYKPRGRARVAICIPLVVFITIASTICWIWSSVKTPTMQFVDWAKVEFENIDEGTFDKDRFNAITNEEFNNITSTIDEDEFTSMIENSTGSNILEKLAYTIFALGQQGLENSLEKYYDESYEVNSTGNNIEDNTENTYENEENTSTENVEVFTKEEQNDIEQILNILE